MVKHIESAATARLRDELKQVRAAPIEQTRVAQELSRKRGRLINAVLAEGFSQAARAGAVGGTRQAIEKMVAVGQDASRR
jgi:hypothetical protein